MKKKEIVVYQIENLISGKLYIGITVNLKRRMNDHFNESKRNRQYIHNAINKYGKENFIYKIIDYGNSWKELEEKEIYWIDKLNTYKNGYNNTLGGDGTLGFIPNKKSRDKMSKAAIGKKATKQAKENMSKAQKGRIVSKEARKNISKAAIGRIPWNKGKTYKLSPHTEERKKQITEDLKRFYKTEAGKKRRKEISKNSKIVRAGQKFPMNDSKIEVKIQNFLKQLGIDFFTHQYMKEIEHSYQCDILIPSMNLVIEVDGDYWHHYPIGNALDHIRTKELINRGFKVLRLWERNIKVMGLDEFKKELKNMENKK